MPEAIFSRLKLVIILEILRLKMEVTVSVPCDGIRVLNSNITSCEIIHALKKLKKANHLI